MSHLGKISWEPDGSHILDERDMRSKLRINYDFLAMSRYQDREQCIPYLLL